MRRQLARQLALACGIAACAFVLSACGTIVYRMEVQQGNLVSQEKVAQLKPGMTKDQVRFVLGTPLVTDIFHANRWDYVFTLQPARSRTIAEERRLTLIFNNEGRLDRVEGDVIPAASESGRTAENK